MKRGSILIALLVVGGLSLGVSAVQQQAAGGGQQQPQTITVDKLKDNLFVLRGGGGNTAVFVGTTGVVLVDAKNPGWGQRIIGEVRKLTNKPITHMINTHSHFDHTGGNVEFEPDVEIVTHDNTKPNIDRWALPTGIAQQPDSPFKTNPGKGMPDRTFKDRLTINKGADQVDLFYFGRGHTNGDAWVLFPALRVVHSGDIFANKGLPILDAANGGSGVEMPETLTKAADTLAKNTAETIITGHAQTTMTLADLREWAEFNRDFLNTVREGKKTGRSVDDIAGAYKIPAKFTGYNMPQPARVKANVQVTFDEIR
jgi:glyoxylase-like metal-dependent hydrolase (beta-lactamase superfamily II)